MFGQKKTPQERLEEIQEKSQKAIQLAIQINTKIEAANDNKKKLNDILMSKYNTTDVKEIEAILSQWEEENEKELKKAEDALQNLEKESQEKMEMIKKIQQG